MNLKKKIKDDNDTRSKTKSEIKHSNAENDQNKPTNKNNNSASKNDKNKKVYVLKEIGLNTSKSMPVIESKKESNIN